MIQARGCSLKDRPVVHRPHDHRGCNADPGRSDRGAAERRASSRL